MGKDKTELTDNRLQEAIDALELARRQLAECSANEIAAADPAAIDPATIIAMIDIIMKLIAAWRARRNPTPAA